MMFLFLPMRTKKVPMIDVMVQAPQMNSGNAIIAPRSGDLAKKIAASTMVATVVTA